MRTLEYKYGTNKIKKYYFCGILFLQKEWGIFYKKTKLFGLTISSMYPKHEIIENKIMFKDFFIKKKQIKKKVIEVVIPVNKDLQNLERLLKEIERNTDLDYNLLIINRNEKSEDLFNALSKLAHKFGQRLTVFQDNEKNNLTKTIKNCLKNTKNDIVILNENVCLPKNWASRLMAPIFESKNVKSVVPISNLNKIFKDINSEDLYKNFQKIDKVLSKLKLQIPVTSETEFLYNFSGCIAVSKDVLNQLDYLMCDKKTTKSLHKIYPTLAYNMLVFYKYDEKEKAKLVEKANKLYCKDIYNDKDIYDSIQFALCVLYLNALAKKTFVVFDHSLGGGTEVYFENKKNKLKEDNLIIRIQYFPNSHAYILTLYNKNTEISFLDYSIENIYELLSNIKIDNIIINNLVGYTDSLAVLKLVGKLKKKDTTVTMMGHDYQSICPYFTLINNERKYCGAPCINQCKNCFKNNRYFNNDDEGNKVLLSGAMSIEKWRKEWGNFFKEIIDEMIVFSQTSQDIFLRVYPSLKEKIKLIPHETKQLRKVYIRPHKSIKIGILGNISSEAKGGNIIENMASIIDGKKIKLIIIGECHKNKKISQTGKYNIEKLPKIIERNCIDIIFIPSIWPETFSYTTSEAMSMGIPVACFDIGAPAERVKKYKYGLIIEKIDAKFALEKIVKFLHKD